MSGASGSDWLIIQLAQLQSVLLDLATVEEGSLPCAVSMPLQELEGQWTTSAQHKLNIRALSRDCLTILLQAKRAR